MRSGVVGLLQLKLDGGETRTILCMVVDVGCYLRGLLSQRVCRCWNRVRDSRELPAVPLGRSHPQILNATVLATSEKQ